MYTKFGKRSTSTGCSVGTVSNLRYRACSTCRDKHSFSGTKLGNLECLLRSTAASSTAAPNARRSRRTFAPCTSTTTCANYSDFGKIVVARRLGPGTRRAKNLHVY